MMHYPIYQIELPPQPESVAFVNGFLTRDFTGFLWLWTNLFWINQVTTQAEGCVQVKAGICGPTEVMMVSYWRSEHSLKQFFRGKRHQQMMQFVAKHPSSLCLYNEIYQPSQVGKYIHEPQGMATIYPQFAKDNATRTTK
jgi:Domain of unknown function (DUF4188)